MSGGKENDKEFKICDVLGGLDVTRLVSTRARSFFASAIDDVELSREFLAEAVSGRAGIVGGGNFASLEEMARSLDWRARGLAEDSTTVDAGIGYSDDRPDRRFDRFMSVTESPLVGDKQSDFDMLNSFSSLFPWLVDRKSKEAGWWRNHTAGQSEGASKEPFAFDILYTAAWSVSWGGAVVYYPPLSVYGHPLTMGDIVGGNYSSREEKFVVPTLPEENPERKAIFTKPYPDTAMPGLALITAAAPIYFTGEFQGHIYDDTFIGTTGVDMAVSSVSSYLDVLQDSLTPNSFGVLVETDSFGTIVISQQVVNRIYPERTGFEESRVTYDLDGGIIDDRRNQTYLPSDTILQDITKLDNANWGRLLKTVQGVAPGERGFTTIDITLTGEKASNEFYVMFEQWQYVAEWSLLVFAPKKEVEQAINVMLETDSNVSQDNTANIKMELERGTSLKGQGTIVNQGYLDVIVSTKSLPSWATVNASILEAFPLRSGENKTFDFVVSTSELDIGTQSSAIVFDVQDADYPDCFFNEDLSLGLTVQVTSKTCGTNEVAAKSGICVCSPHAIDISGHCISQSALVAVSTLIPLVILCAIGVYITTVRKRRAEDAIWTIDPSELKFDGENPEIIGEGSFGAVVLGEYRGTSVAVKRLQASASLSCRSKTGSRELLPDDRSCLSNSRASSLSEDCCSVDFSVNDLETARSSPEQRRYSTGSHVSSQVVGKKSSLHRDENFVKEMRLLSKLRHPCVTTVMGAVVNKKHAPMLVMEYMEHGSLYNIIHNETMDFEGEILLAILKDITQGIQFLHNSKPQVVHKDLKSHNILVDSHFRAKVADFGLSANKNKISATGTPFWMAPELLRGETVNTAASDVYSLGIVLYEIYSRKEPYEGEDFDAVLRGVKDPNVQERPPVPSCMTPGISAIMHDCLVEDAEERATINEICNRMKRFEPSAVEPKGLARKLKPGEKNFDVLLKMFPRHIAEALRDGRKVEPEHHDTVTIFFSDIVGFTTISSEMPPEKVSDMLHRLFAKFDSLGESHAVHKVETIGDAWMGVTNCVRDQSTDHVKRIAEFSLKAVQAANETLINLDDPSRGHVQIRVGFHSGPVLSNVIGSAQPRYSLFGDTVNTAARMESNSKPGHIHCSERAAMLLLDQAPELQVKARGAIQVKGKGLMNTYWLVQPEHTRTLIEA